MEKRRPIWPDDQKRGVGCAIVGIPVMVGLIAESWLVGIVTWLVLSVFASYFNMLRTYGVLYVQQTEAHDRITELERQVEELQRRTNDDLQEDQAAANRRIAVLEEQVDALKNRLNRF